MRFSVAASLALISAVVAQSQLTINTPPSLIECQPYAVSWSGGTSPYYVSVIPGGQQSAAALEFLGTQPQAMTSYSWTVDIAAGTSITLKVVDSAGISAFSAPVSITAGTSTACLASGGGAATSGAASSGAASSAAPSSSAAATTSAAAATTSAAAATTSAAAATTTTRAADMTTASAAPAATTTRPASGASLSGYSSTLLGLVGAAFLAIGA